MAAGRFPELDDRQDLWKVLVMLTARKAVDQLRRGHAQKRGGGLVRGERRGYFVHYSLDQDRLEQYKAGLLETLGEDFVVIK